MPSSSYEQDQRYHLWLSLVGNVMVNNLLLFNSTCEALRRGTRKANISCYGTSNGKCLYIKYARLQSNPLYQAGWPCLIIQPASWYHNPRIVTKASILVPEPTINHNVSSTTLKLVSFMSAPHEPTGLKETCSNEVKLQANDFVAEGNDCLHSIHAEDILVWRITEDDVYLRYMTLRLGRIAT